MEPMDFGWALKMMRLGKFVQRVGWNGKGMYLFLNPGSEVKVSEGRPLAARYPIGTPKTFLPYIMMSTVDGSLVPWLASQTDILAEDWDVLD